MDVVLWALAATYALLSSFLMAIANVVFIQTLLVQKRRASVRYASSRRLRNKQCENSTPVNESLVGTCEQNKDIPARGMQRSKSTEIPITTESNTNNGNENDDGKSNGLISTLHVPKTKRQISRTVSNTPSEYQQSKPDAELLVERRFKKRVKTERIYVTMVVLFTISYFVLTSSSVGMTIYGTLFLNPNDPEEAPIYELCFVGSFVFSTLNVLNNAIFFFSSSEAFREQARQVWRRKSICSKLGTLGLF